ncbi:MAG TPA: hypothetical protein VN578_18185 [Candidatus Binatia bacterium]|jgi:hypothetical protein|nr:hypothetical protein [Candidatus Binatia bacterium]
MMTLNQAERLVRKIAELLGQPALEAQAAKLAQDYSELARAAHRRLEQCATMIEASDELQALQLAEAPPPLLDLITLLSFRQAAEWRAYCQGHNLPWAEPFFDKYVRLVNATYGKGIASDHPYYRDYRRAVMQNEDERALSILRVIARLNPADQNSAQELRRFEEKTLRARLEELRVVLDKGEPEAVLLLVAKLEGSALNIPPANPIWQRAQVVRCQKLLGQGRALREQEAWEEAELLVEEIRALATHHALVFPSADADFFEALEGWTAQKRTALVQEQDFQRAVEGLQYQAQVLESKRGSNGRSAPAELQSDFDTLGAKWREAERFGRPLDGPLVARCQENCDWLQRAMNRSRSRKRVTSALTALVASAAVVVAGLFGWNFFEQRQVVEQLGRFQSRRQVGEAQRLLAGMPARFKTQGRAGAAFVKAQQFIAKEMELKGNFSQQLDSLNALAQQSSSEVLAKVDHQRADCGQALEQLAPEFQSEGKAKLAGFDERWQKRLQALQPEQNAQFAARLAEAERAAAERLNAARGFAAVQGSLPQVQALVAELTKSQNQRAGLDEGLERRCRQLTNQVNGMARAADQWTELTAKVPHSLEEHLARLNQISQSPFASAAERDVIADLGRVDVSLPALLGALLLPHYRQGWDSLTNVPDTAAAFMPTAPTAQEKDACAKLQNDPNLQEVNDYYLTKHPHPGNPLEDHHVFVRGRLEKNKFFQDAGLIYDWKKSPDALRFEQQVLNSFDYVQADYKGLTRECAAFQALGLRELLSSDNTHYQRSVLELLDHLNQDTDSSALFRAYVTLKLRDIAQQRPMEWGLTWSPAAALHFQKLMELGAQNLQSGDWMVSNRVARVKAPLEKYFEQSRAMSFEKQAQFYYRLTRRACEAGFTFAGYVDAQGNPVLAQANAVRGEYWGWSSRSRGPVLLLRRAEGAQACQKLEDPLPLTPLFVFRGDRREFLEQTARATLYSLRGADSELPPLFLGLKYE